MQANYRPVGTFHEEDCFKFLIRDVPYKVLEVPPFARLEACECVITLALFGVLVF